MTTNPTNPPAITSPVGDLWLEIEAGNVVSLSWQSLPEPKNQADKLIWEKAKKWLNEYFQPTKSRKIFTPPDFPIKPKGTKFQQSVWTHLLKIPSGSTETYGTVAQNLKSGPRAIGQAVGANPIPIIIPCHRVVAVNGLGGYSGLGGIECKKKLLALESL
jgi:methylated-DNA-[protein]-cysteine S-methyltransferase